MSKKNNNDKRLFSVEIDGSQKYEGSTTKSFRGMCPGGVLAYYYNFDKVHKIGPWKEIR